MRIGSGFFRAEKCYATFLFWEMEIGERKVNPRIMKLVSSVFNINLNWLETGKGEMFQLDTENEIAEIISLYKRLNPFFKKFIIRQLYDLIDYKDE